MTAGSTGRSGASVLATLRRLWPLVHRRLTLLMCWLAALAVSSAAMLSLPLAARHVIDEGFVADSLRINTAFMLLLAVVAVLALATALRAFYVSLLAERVVCDLRNQLYAHLIRLDHQFHDRNRSSELSARLSADTELVRGLVGRTLPSILRSGVVVAGSIAMLFITHPRLAMLAVLVVPVAVIPIAFAANRLQRIARFSQDQVAEANALAGETLGAIRTVQAHAYEAHESERFASALQAALAATRHRVRYQSGMTALAIMLVFGAIVLVLWIGAHDVAAGRMSAGTLGQFVLYAVIGGASFSTIAEIWNELHHASGGMGRIDELLHESPSIVPPVHVTPLAHPVRGELVFDDVTFRYPQRPDHPALHDFSLHVRAGETVALVGASGAGKSTVFSLLLRFYDPACGRVRLDGVPVDLLEPADLRRAFALVPQQPTIFAGTARDNVLYGRLDASDGELEAALNAAHAADFVASLPDGLDTQLGERGARLSGGEQQRIVIARAFLRNAPVLLLDEATSALDANSERAVQLALETLMQNRTTLVIAHRLSTVLKADRIVVMEKGRVVAQGRHHELMAQGGLYADLAKLQFLDARDVSDMRVRREVEAAS